MATDQDAGAAEMREAQSAGPGEVHPAGLPETQIDLRLVAHGRRWGFLLRDRTLAEAPAEDPSAPWLNRRLQRLLRELAAFEATPPSGRISDWLRQALHWLRARTDPHEPLLLRLRTAKIADIRYPDSAGARRAHRVLRWFLRAQLGRLRLGIVLNLLLLPLTAVLTLVPGPNVFLFWNGYRLVIHVLCARGARRALLALHEPPATSPAQGMQPRLVLRWLPEPTAAFPTP